MIVADVKTNLTGMLHGGSLNKVRNIDLALERAGNVMLSKIHPAETMRVAELSQTVHDDFDQYALPSDYRDLIDIYPQAERGLYDSATRRPAEAFSLERVMANRQLSIEGVGGSKVLKLNWKSRASKTLHGMNSVAGNGTWSAVGGATGIVADNITKYSGSAAIRFDLASSGDGIQNSSMSALDLTNEDEVADVFIPIYIRNSADVAKLTSVTGVWGNDLTTNYWTGVAQTAQADGTAFRVGWNIIKIPWSTADETGTVAPSTIDAFKLTLTTTGAISDIRVDNIIFSIGRNFDIKYYSKYLMQDSNGVWISRTTSDDDTVILDNDAIEIYLLEALKQCAHQIEGADSAFDISWATLQLNGDPRSSDPVERMGLYAKYRKMYPSQAKKQRGTYGSMPGNRRWSGNKRLI